MFGTSTARELAAKLDVPYHLGERAIERGVDYGFEPLAGGETVPVGDVGIEALSGRPSTTCAAKWTSASTGGVRRTAGRGPSREAGQLRDDHRRQ